jgi:hypothetical protein
LAVIHIEVYLAKFGDIKNMKGKINFLTLSYCKQTVTILAKFSLELFLFKKENLQQNIPSSKSPQKKLQREKARSQVFVVFFWLRAFAEELENFVKLFPKKCKFD